MTASAAGWLCGSCGHIEAGDHQALEKAQSAPAASPAAAPAETPPAPASRRQAVQVDVDMSLKHYLQRQSLMPVYLLGWLLGVGLLFVQGLGLYVLIGMGLWTAYLRQQLITQLLQQFAEANGFSFSKTGSVSRDYGNLFRQPGYGEMLDAVTGQYGGRQINFFLYARTVQHGRSSSTYKYSVVELNLPANAPHILIRHKARLGQWDEAATADLAPLRLEGDFDDRLEALVAKGNEVEALTVLTPDVMAIIADHIERFDIELVANRFYAYTNTYIKSSQDIIAMLDLADMVLDKVVPVILRNQDQSQLVVPEAQSSQAVSPYSDASYNSVVATRVVKWFLLPFIAPFILVMLFIAFAVVVALTHPRPEVPVSTSPAATPTSTPFEPFDTFSTPNPQPGFPR